MNEKILVLDFGSQYNQLIIRRIRNLGVFAELKPSELSIEEIKAYNPSGIILSGGPASVYDKDAPSVDPEVFNLGLPILGICYGMQLMMQSHGGEIKASNEREYGKALLEKMLVPCPLTEGIELENSQVWMSHGDSVTTLPKGFECVSTTSSTPFTIVQNTEKHLYGLQFHPEVVHSLNGTEIIENFLRKICKTSSTWEMKSYLEESLIRIKEKVGPDDKVILGLSGGVDSSVMALLLDKALGPRVRCVFVDNGLLRLNEGDKVEKMFTENFHLNFTRVDASKIFYERLAGVSDPEKKRKIIGNTFIEVFDNEVANEKAVKWLAQGTIYPDVIESTSTHGASVTIKSHHNVGGLPDDMNLSILEPLRELFKDEVRALGKELGLPDSFIGRHPFPGPGLAVRIIGEVTPAACEVLCKADDIFLREIINAGKYDDIAQAFAVLLPVKSVGVMGDGRTYENVVALRAVTTTDFMTADWYRFDPDLLSVISSKIIGEVKGINRVVYDITSKPPGTIEWE
jgi:GMP synthase (glutamine-hydrolysing)